MKNFIIYEIFNESLNFRYIGSTGNFSSRKSTHKSNCKKQLKQKLYETINKCGGWDNFTMRPIEYIECQNKLEARIRERYWCEMYNPNLNTRMSYISGEEKDSYYEDNKDRFKQYYEDNKERIKQYYQDNREKRLKYQKQRCLRQKEYIKKKGIYIAPEELTEEITLKIHEPECVEAIELNYLDNIDAPKISIITDTGDITEREKEQTLESIIN